MRKTAGFGARLTGMLGGPERVVEALIHWGLLVLTSVLLVIEHHSKASILVISLVGVVVAGIVGLLFIRRREPMLPMVSLRYGCRPCPAPDLVKVKRAIRSHYEGTFVPFGQAEGLRERFPEGTFGLYCTVSRGRTERSEIVGYFALLGLTEAAWTGFLAGTLKDQDIAAEHVVPVQRGAAPPRIYLQNIAVVADSGGSEHAKHLRASLLFRGILRWLAHYAADGTPRTIYTLPINAASKAMARRTGFRGCGAHNEGYEVHALEYTSQSLKAAGRRLSQESRLTMVWARPEGQ